VCAYNIAGDSGYSNEASATPGGAAGDLFASDDIAGNMRFVPATEAGGFAQGSDASEPCSYDDEEPFKHVLTRNLAVMETEVTRELCWDYYRASYPTGTVSNYLGPTTGTARIIRGGSWYNKAELCRSALRNSMEPDGGVPHGSQGRMKSLPPRGSGSAPGERPVEDAA
jgi:hypothetical protein